MFEKFNIIKTSEVTWKEESIGVGFNVFVLNISYSRRKTIEIINFIKQMESHRKFTFEFIMN